MNCNNSLELAQKITDIYSNFGVKIGKLIGVNKGARVSRFEFELSPDTKVSKITMLRDDISLMLSVPKVRIICPVPNKTAFAVEIANGEENFVPFDEVFCSDAFKNSTDKLCIALGKNLANESVCLELSKAPHLLIGGEVYSGKTTLLKSIILSLVLNNDPSQLKLLLIAPKKDELEIFEGVKHLLSPVICDSNEAFEHLDALAEECNNRIKLFAENSVRNIDAYNNLTDQKIERIVAIIDETSFLTEKNPRAFETAICTLAQMGRMAGIHIVLATKQLSPQNITGIIKANIPTRIALSTKTAIESRNILDSSDAECLLLKGDLLLLSMLNKPQRIQAAYITDCELQEKIVKF